MKPPAKETLARLRETYRKGMRVELIQMDDPYTKLKPGEKGTIDHVDDMAGIHINWDSGSMLAAVWGEDIIKIITE